MIGMQRTVKSLALGTAVALSACASLPPQQQSAYVQARDEVQQLQSDPLAVQAAGQQLQQAREDLSNADNAARRNDANDVLYWSYLAMHEAQIGEAQTAELRARTEVAAANAERERILLESQHRQTQLAQERAQRAEQEAQAAREAQQQTQQVAQQAQQQADQATQAAQQQSEQARLQAQQAQEQLEQARLQTQQAEQQLEQLKARQTDRGMVLTLSNSVLFATGSDTLEPGAESALHNVTEFMQQHPKVKLRVEGFTDSRGSDAYNDALSQRRAEAVAKAFESDGLDASRVESIGRGKSMPLASNDEAAGRQQNRRVEIVFSNLEGQFGRHVAEADR